MTTETMDRQGEDFMVCPCGNAPHLDGFYCSDEQGTYLDDLVSDERIGPDPSWDGDTMACFSCGRVFSLESAAILGTMTPEMLAGARCVIR